MTKIIVVGGTKGGPGKSTVAQQIAVCLKVKKKKKIKLPILIFSAPQRVGAKTVARTKILS